jgi:FHS family L-fucose permease-like MFS transporter
MGNQQAADANARSSFLALALITSLFFFWGMANALNDVLIPQFKKVFHLSDLQSGLVQSAFYAGYFIFALPAAAIMQRYGFKVAILVGLSLFALGAFAFYPAADLLRYAPFLAALFILASGLAFLETSANPLVTVLGNPKGAAFRLNLAQAFNPLGSLVGIWIGQRFILSGIDLAQSHLTAQAHLNVLAPQALHAFYVHETHAVQLPYLIIGGVISGLALLVFWTRFPRATTQAAATTELSFAKSVAALFLHGRFLFGVAAQFFYVGAQVGVWSYTIKYAQAETGQTDKAAVVFLIYNYVAFTIGRFGGAALMRVLPPIWIFSAFAVFNIVLATLAATTGGWIGLWCLVGTSLFMSVMYPTIFAVSLEGLGALTKSASSLLVMSIIGGAVLTPIMGLVSDQAHLIRIALYVPAGCFTFLAIFGIVLSYLKARRKSASRVGDFAPSMGT